MKTNGVSRNLRLVAKVIKNINQDQTLNIKTLLFDKKYRFYNIQAVHALVNEVVKHENDLNKILEDIDLLKVEKRLDPWLAKAYLTEILWGKKKLIGDGDLTKTILSYEDQCWTILGPESKEPIPKASNTKVIKPRYLRVNTLLTSVADAVRSFQDEGWQLVRCKNDSYEGYLKQLEGLQEDQFIPDFHVKVVFAFPPNTMFYNHPLYFNSEILLQDKATTLAAFLLSPTPGSTVLDMCAAPGMKTTHLASIIKNEGTVYAVEKDEKRCETLKQFVESTGATCVKVINKDVLTVNKDECPNVDYILLDPSCSGSGMPRAEQNDFDFDFKSGRIRKLANFQAKMLRHALNEFRTAKRVVYSTCSLYPQENEEVLLDVIKNHKGDYELVSAKKLLNDAWTNVGDKKYFEIGEKCLYARPDMDQTCGFFLAVFEKKEKKIKDKKDIAEVVEEKVNKEKDEEKHENVIKKIEKEKEINGIDEELEKNNKKKNKHKVVMNKMEEGEEIVEVSVKKEKKHKKKQKAIAEEEEIERVSEVEENKLKENQMVTEEDEKEVKKEKGRKKKQTMIEEEEEILVNSVKGKKKHKNKQIVTTDEEEKIEKEHNEKQNTEVSDEKKEKKHKKMQIVTEEEEKVEKEHKKKRKVIEEEEEIKEKRHKKKRKVVEEEDKDSEKELSAEHIVTVEENEKKEKKHKKKRQVMEEEEEKNVGKKERKKKE